MYTCIYIYIHIERERHMIHVYSCCDSCVLVCSCLFETTIQIDSKP